MTGDDDDEVNDTVVLFMESLKNSNNVDLIRLSNYTCEVFFKEYTKIFDEIDKRNKSLEYQTTKNIKNIKYTVDSSSNNYYINSTIDNINIISSISSTDNININNTDNIDNTNISGTNNNTDTPAAADQAAAAAADQAAADQAAADQERLAKVKNKDQILKKILDKFSGDDCFA